MMTLREAFSQGARCGHLEGRSRVGAYVRGEEHELSWEAAENQNLPSVALTVSWGDGYRYGYLLGASGDPLPPEHAL